MIRTIAYDNILIRHAYLFAALVLLVFILNRFGALNSITQQLILLTVLLAFSGIPHGALDYRLSRQWLKPGWGRFWSIRFLGAYTLLMLVVLMIWFVAPVFSLAAFLFITAFHFGTGDALTTRRMPSGIRMADMIGRGGIVLAFPALLFSSDVLQLFSYLVPESGARLLTRSLMVLAIPVALAMLTVVIYYGRQYLKYGDRVSLSRVIELAAIVFAFSLLPALLAFTVYFNFLHAVRHILSVAGSLESDNFVPALVDTFKSAVPVTLATIGLGAAAYAAIAPTGLDIARLTQVIFIGIACMTYPHVLVIALAQRVRVIKPNHCLVSA